MPKGKASQKKGRLRCKSTQAEEGHLQGHKGFRNGAPQDTTMCVWRTGVQGWGEGINLEPEMVDKKWMRIPFSNPIMRVQF